MDDFPATESRTHLIYDLITHLELIKHMMNELDDSKQKAEKQLRDLLNHPEIDGSKSYKVDKYALKVTTGLNHTLDKKKYTELKGMINPKFDPVKEVVKLELNKKTLRDCLEFGTQDEIYLQSQFIISTPKKLHISIEKKKDEKINSPDFGDDAFGLSSSSDSN